MTLRGKYNGAKHETEAWDVDAHLMPLCRRRRRQNNLPIRWTEGEAEWYEMCGHVVGERRIRGEVRAEARVDCIRVRMPE